MKAREVLAKQITIDFWDCGDEVANNVADAILAALLSAPEATRLELARALVKAEEWRVVKVPEEYPVSIEMTLADAGYNDAIREVLASEGGEGE